MRYVPSGFFLSFAAAFRPASWDTRSIPGCSESIAVCLDYEENIMDYFDVDEFVEQQARNGKDGEPISFEPDSESD